MDYSRHYWSNPNASLVSSFPLKASFVCLVTVGPLLVALVIFRRKAYEGHLVVVVGALKWRTIITAFQG